MSEMTDREIEDALQYMQVMTCEDNRPLREIAARYGIGAVAHEAVLASDAVTELPPPIQPSTNIGREHNPYLREVRYNETND